MPLIISDSNLSLFVIKLFCIVYQFHFTSFIFMPLLLFSNLLRTISEGISLLIPMRSAISVTDRRVLSLVIFSQIQLISLQQIYNNKSRNRRNLKKNKRYNYYSYKTQAYYIVFDHIAFFLQLIIASCFFLVYR